MVCGLAGAAPAFAGTQRFALIVANHGGGPGLAKLRYSGRDGERFADVLADLGRFERTDMLSVVDGTSDDVKHALDAIERRVEDAKRAGDATVMLFYYSGHAQNGVLRLGESALDMQWLRTRLEGSTADVRLAFIDSCGAGAMTREKGGVLAPPFVVAVDEKLGARGQVIISSSSADEASQESDDIQGSFFTHYLATGLRGDADRDHDGRVTLDEAYGYAYGRTVAATSATRAGAQHPTYAYDLHGAGDVTLTEPGGADVLITFPEDLRGQYFIVDLDRQLFVAEVDKESGARSNISLPKGQYAIKKRTDTHVLLQKVQARAKGTFVVDETAMEQLAFADDYAKGTPVLSAALQEELGWSLSIGLGGQVVVDSVDNGGMLPALPFVRIEGRVHNLFRPHVVGSVDVGFGSVDGERVLDVGAGPPLRFPQQYSQFQAGASVLYEQAFGPLVLAGGGRVAGIFVDVKLANAPLAEQVWLQFTPGLVGMVGFQPLKNAHVELMARAHYLPYNVDEFRSMALLEGVGSVWFDF